MALCWAAQALSTCGSWEEAERYTKRVLDLNPNLALGHYVMALVCVRYKKTDDVQKQVDALVNLAPKGRMTHHGMAFRGLAYHMTGDYELARQAMEQALLLEPGFVYPLKDIAVSCEKQGQHEAALDAIRRLRLADPAITLEELEAFTLASLFPPDLAEESIGILRRIWPDTQKGSAAK
jgi:tetratricopeptide (TPR) repeat protein